MKYQKLKKRRLVLEDKKLISYIEETRGIKQDVASSFLLKFDLLLTPHGVPHGRWYSFVGLDGASVVNSYYEKLHTINIDRDNIMPLIIGNQDSRTAYFFQSQWDFLAFLTLMEVDWKAVYSKFKFIIFTNTTKNALKTVKNVDKVILLHRIKNTTFLNNTKKVFENVITKEENYQEFGSLSNKVRGIML